MSVLMPPTRRPAPADKPYLASFSALRHELARRGFFQRDTSGILLELVWHSALALLGLTAFIMFPGFLLRGLATVVWGVGLAGIAANTHSASHYATAGRRWVNELLTYVGYAVVTGFSATYWWHKHLHVHHRHPNVAGLDVDLDWMPLFALTEVDRKRARPWRSWFHAYQGWIVPLAISLNLCYGQWHSLRFLAKQLAGSSRRWNHWIDAGCLGLHVVLWLLLPMLVLPWTSVIGFYLLRAIVLGYLFFLLNAPSHYPAEAICLANAEAGDFVYRQTATTVNFRTGWLGAMLCSGVQYQIEHHLFCGISHTRYRAVSPLVKEFCCFHGYPYRTLGWEEAIGKAILAFQQSKPVINIVQEGH